VIDIEWSFSKVTGEKLWSAVLRGTATGKGGTAYTIGRHQERRVHEALSKMRRDSVHRMLHSSEIRYLARVRLHLAAKDGAISRVKHLIAEGADINARDNQGRTPLYEAILGGNVNTVKLLTWHGADINARDNQGRTPLHLASGRNHQAVTELLIDQGADVNATDKDGDTPLNVAIQMGHTDMVTLLKQHGSLISD